MTTPPPATPPLEDESSQVLGLWAVLQHLDAWARGSCGRVLPMEDKVGFAL